MSTLEASEGRKAARRSPSKVKRSKFIEHDVIFLKLETHFLIKV